MIKGIFFDIGWTLFYPQSGDWMLTSKCAEIAGGALRSVARDKLEAAYAEGMRFLDDNHLLFTEAEQLSQFKKFYSIIAGLLPELTDAQINEIAHDKVYNRSNDILYDDVRSALERLSRTYKLSIISDTWPSAAAVLKSAGIYDYFQAITLSCELGVCKPNPKIYEHALASIGLPPEETMFIDDSVENLDGAAKLGITPVLIHRSNYPREIRPGGYKTIQTLNELE